MSTRRVNGAAVKALRLKQQLAGSKVATAAGMSDGHLFNVERGIRQLSEEKAEALAEALGVPIEAITYPVCDLPHPSAA